MEELELTPQQVARNFANALRNSQDFKTRFNQLVVELLERGATDEPRWNSAMEQVLPIWKLMPEDVRAHAFGLARQSFEANQRAASATAVNVQALPDCDGTSAADHTPEVEADEFLKDVKASLEERRRRAFTKVPWEEQSARAGIHLDRARIPLFNGDYPQAIGELEEAVKKQPGAGEAWRLLSKGQELAGNLDAALECMQNAVRVEPTLPDIQYELGKLRARIGSTQHPAEPNEPIRAREPMRTETDGHDRAPIVAQLLASPVATASILALTILLTAWTVWPGLWLYKMESGARALGSVRVHRVTGQVEEFRNGRWQSVPTYGTSPKP